MATKNETYQANRVLELGMPEGTGKRYSGQDLRNFIRAVEEEHKSLSERSRVNEKIVAYLDSQRDGNIYRGPFKAEELRQLWGEAVEQELVTTSERLFYLGVDILRIRLGPGWFGRTNKDGHKENLSAGEKFKRPDKMAFQESGRQWVSQGCRPSIYSLHFYAPAFVSPADFLSLRAEGEALPTEHIEIIRLPVSREHSDEKGFYDQQFSFVLGKPMTVHYCSRFYDAIKSTEELGDFEIELHTTHELNLTSQQLQTFGRRLWQAHLNTPVKRD